MATVVEATSLESIQAIAADPPTNPNAALLRHTQPLILYLARVPGSRDVFLTLMKPHQKVVTAEDVTRSLYYVHANAETDYQHGELQRAAKGENSGRGYIAGNPKAGAVSLPVLPPRPLSTSTISETGNTALAPALPPRNSPGARQAPRKSIPSSMQQRLVRRQPPATTDAPKLPSRPQQQPRPLPTPPDEEPFDCSLHDGNIHLLRELEYGQEENPYIRDYTTHPETLKQLELDARPQPGTLTLIRRDPTSNEQWNVATIHDSRTQKSSSQSSLLPTAARKTKQDGSPIYVEVTNPGYTHFIDEGLRTPSRNSTSSTSSDSATLQSGVFRRKLYIPDLPHIQHEPNYYGHQKESSISSTGSIDTLQSARHGTRLEFDPHDLGRGAKRNKNYVFASPWNGTCRFTSSATDTSLKCRHALVGSNTEQVVSELRFSLPSSNDGNRSARPSSSYIPRRGHAISSEEGQRPQSAIFQNDAGHLDLSLGQEKAGGGFGGKQAKLGKLIIEREGLKMLDLLVAANIGLWWRAYERLT